MKTIEEKARQHSFKYDDETNQSIAFHAYRMGANFAQKWIQVEDETPAKGIEIIAKNKHRKVVYEVKTNDDVKYICETFTHWRPIEFK